MRNLSRTVAALVAVTVGSASAGVNAAPSRRASLTVDTSDLGETGPIVKRRIQERVFYRKHKPIVSRKEIETNADIRRLLSAFSRLLTVLDGLTTAEAGRLLGIPQGTVKTRMKRAREQLREELA